MKTNKLGFLGLLTIIAFNYALMEKTPLQIIKQDISRSVASSDIAVTSTTEVTKDEYKPAFVGLSTVITETDDLKKASTECYAFLKDVLDRDNSTISSNSCYFQTSVCKTETVKLYKIDLREVEKEDINNRPLAKKTIAENSKKAILTQLNTQFNDHKDQYCEVKNEEKVVETETEKEELLPASKTDTVETASNGQIPNQTTGKAATETIKTSSIVMDPDLVEYASVREECAAIKAGVKADRRRTYRRTNTDSAADRYANRDQKVSIRQPITPDYDLTDDLLENAEEILNDELTTKSEMKYCLRTFKRSKNSQLRTLAKDFETIKKQEEKVAKQVKNSLKNYDFAAAQINQRQGLCLQQAQYMAPRHTQQPMIMNAQPHPYYAQNQQMIQQVNQGAQQAYDAQVRNCQVQYNTDNLRSQYSNGLSNYLQSSTNYLQGRVQTSSAVSSYQAWVQNEITAMQNALGYNTGFTTPSFIPGNTQRTFSPSSTTNIQQPVVSPNVANQQVVQSTLPGTSTLSSYQVTGNYSQTMPTVARPNFAPLTNNTVNGQIPRRPSQLQRTTTVRR